MKRDHGWLASLLDAPPAWGALDADNVCWGLGSTPEAARHDAAAHSQTDELAIAALTAAAQRQTARGNPHLKYDRTVPGAAFAAEEETLTDWVASTVEAAGAIGERAEQYAAMLRAYAYGHPAVTLSARGLPHWTANATLRRDAVAGDARPARLSERWAAEEMAENLQQDRWLRARAAGVEAEKAARRARLASLGQALFGREWISPTARALGVEVRTIQRYASGERGDAPRAALIDELHRLIPNRRTELLQWLATLDREAAAE